MTALILKSMQQAKRLITVVLGFTVIFIGILMIILPGPAVIVIPIGLGILATEFVWARKLLKKMKTGYQKIKNNKPVNEGKNSK